MREPARDLERLEHIATAIEKVLQYTDGISYEELIDDSMRLHATVYNVQIIGEAIYKLSAEFKENHKETPWRQIEKTRHILVHDYYQIDNRILWSIIKDDMNPLKQQITQYISEKTKN